MFEVECPSCKAGYKVDERRVPSTGLKMRCPKCGESFQVSGLGLSEPPVLGAALGLAPDKSHGPKASKRTMMGIAPAHQSTPSPALLDDELELESLDDDDALDLSDEELEADLPQPARDLGWSPPKAASRPKEIDLFGGSEPPPGDRDIGGEFELPSPSASLPDLPRPGGKDGTGVADLPDLIAAGLPSPTIGLPSPSEAGLPESKAELPSLGGELPSLGGNLPAPAGRGLLPSLNPETPGLSQPPAPEEIEITGMEDDGFVLSHAPDAPEGPIGDPFGEGPLTRPESVTPGSVDPSSFGEADLGSEDLEEDDVGGEFDAFPTEAGARKPEAASGYGDVTLDDDGGSLGLDEGGFDEDGAAQRTLPRGPAPAASAQVELPGRETTPVVKTPRRGISRGLKWGIGAALLLTVAGGALGAFVPDVGPYGAYVALDLLKKDAYRADLEADVRRAREALQRDTAQSARQAFQIVDRGRAGAPRFRPRAAFAAYVGLLGRIRFGVGATEGAAATALLSGLKEAPMAEVEYLELARLAEKVAGGAPEEALKPALIARGPDHAVLVGEAALSADKPELAIQAFSALSKAETSPRAHFGLARAQLMAGDDAAAEKEAQAVLEATPGHVGAQLLLAERQVRRRRADAKLVELLAPLAKGEGGASVGERTTALILLGEIHMARGRLNDAEKAFASALGLESGNAVAQRGLADALFESGKFSEAQTRYEAALKTDPSSLAAGLGLVRCRIRLEELETAVNLLTQLKKQHPDSTALQYWSGRVEEQLGHREEAEKAYRAAIRQGQPGAELVKSFISLTRLLGQQGKATEADEIIREAEERFPDDPLVYEAQADLASARGSFEAAVEDYDRALALDPENLGLHFAKAVALRKGRQFEAASKELAQVEQAEKNYPGLALEQGNLLEASGRSEEALAAYEKALAEDPDSSDMKLRVGCARAGAGQGEPAVTVLEEVYDDRPNSAEVNFCLGLGYLRMSQLEEARRHLQRAVGFDASRANYHLYVGWVAIEMGNYPLASASLEKALSLDQTLADAYWKRGELRVKQGAVDDAVRDLGRALELSPSRFEAHAQLGLAYLQNGREPQALEEFRKATEQPGVDPYFNYRYGELLLNNRRPAEAQSQLARAIEAVEGREFPPPWLWEAHRLLAMAMGRTREALPHWKAFADHAPTNSPYLADATREMDAILRSAGH